MTNIVFIMADDLGYADVGCYGRRDLSTPNIDRIAERGVRLRQAYANSAVCSATRLALITGRYQYRLPLGLEEPLAGKPDVGLPPGHPTLPSILQHSGYATSLVGKWHLGMPPKFGPARSGYDRFFGIRSGAVDYYSHENPRGEHDLWDGDEPVRRSGYLTEILGDQAVAIINEHAGRGKPFLLSLHFNAPHWPWEAPGDGTESERLRGSNLRHFDGGTQRTYIRMIQAMDLQIGRALQALDANGQADDTVVVFTSDNGGERFSDTWPFTGVKTELLEGGLRDPGIDLLAGADSRRPRQRSGDDHDGLVRHPAGSGGHRAASGLSARRDRPAAGVDRTRPADPAQTVLALQDQRAACRS